MKTESLSNSTDAGFNSKNNPVKASKDAVHDIGRKVGEAASEVANTTAGRYQLSRMYVKKHPLTGVVAATAVGMALGSALTAALRKNV